MKLAICLSEPAELSDVTAFGDKLGATFYLVPPASPGFDLFDESGSCLKGSFYVVNPIQTGSLMRWSHRWWRMSQWLMKARLTRQAEVTAVVVAPTIARLDQLPLRQPGNGQVLLTSYMLDHVDPSVWVADVDTFARVAAFWKFAKFLENRHMVRIRTDDSVERRRDHVWAAWLRMQSVSVEKL